MEDHLNEFVKSHAASGEQVHLMISDFKASQVKVVSHFRHLITELTNH